MPRRVRADASAAPRAPVRSSRRGRRLGRAQQPDQPDEHEQGDHHPLRRGRHGRGRRHPAGAVEVRQGSPTGTVLTTIPLNADRAANNNTYTSPTFPLNFTGSQRLFLVFRSVTGGPTTNIANINWVEFSGPGRHPVVDSGGAAARGAPTVPRSRGESDTHGTQSSTAGRSSAPPPARPAPRRSAPGARSAWGAARARRTGTGSFRVAASASSSSRSATRSRGSTSRCRDTSAGRASRRTRPTSVRWRRCRAASPRSSSTWLPSATTGSSSSRSTKGERRDHPEQIRAALDNAGLRAAGTHTGGLQAMTVPANLQAQIDLAGILGYRMVGTAGNPANPTLGHARRLAGVRRAGQHGRRRVPRRRHQVLLPPRAGLVPLLRRSGSPRARPRAPDRLVHRQHRPQARVLRAGHDAHARRSRAPPRSGRRAAVRRQRLVRPARGRRTG